MIKQNPFSVYDFLGYLIPGAILIYSYLILEFYKDKSIYAVNEFINLFKDFDINNAFFFIIASYVLGHLISFISSITIEKYAVWKYSYPSKYLLQMKQEGYWSTAKVWTDYLWRIVLLIFLAPCVILDLILGSWLNFKSFYQKPLDDLLIDLVLLKTNKLLEKLGLTAKEFSGRSANEHDFHRIISHYAFENTRSHQFKMNNYVALYGFLRNLCLILNILTIYFFLKSISNNLYDFTNLFIIFALSSITYIAFMAFMKFYRRYTLEGFMVLAISDI